MKRFCGLLTPLVLLCTFLIAPMIASAQPGRFIVYDGLAYKGKPDLTGFGLHRIRIAYTSQIWGGSAGHDQPNDQAVRNLARTVDPNVPLVLDIEHWNVQISGGHSEENIRKLIQIVKWIKETNPNIKVGFYGLLPISDPWLELQYAMVERNPDMPKAGAIVRTYQQMQASNQQMQQLAQYVDFVCPVIYTFNNLGGGPPQFQTNWDTATINSIKEAQQYGKPIYAFLWPQFSDAKDPSGDNTFLSTAMWAHELQFLRGSGIQGVILWGSTTFRKSGWNDADPWWQTTKSFLSH
jgi:hypothetical protein